MLHHVLFHQSCVGAEWTLQHSAEGSYSTGNFWFTNMNVMLNEVWFLFLCALWMWRFQKKRQKNISLLKTLNQNICRFSFRWSISRLVTAATVELMCKRSQTVCGGCSRIKVRGISLTRRTDCTDERCIVKAALAESRCGCWQQSVRLGGRRVSERGCCYKFSRGSESVAQFVDGRWPDLCAGVLLLGSHQDSPCSA